MKGLIFSEGNGFGHAARDRLISEHFGFRLMTFGKGADYCRERSMDFMEIPSPYQIQTGKGKVNLVSEPREAIRFLKPDVLATINSHFRKADLIIVDGTPLGLMLAMLARRKAVYITNDISALVGMHGVIERKVAASFQDTLLLSARAVIVPDFPPPMTITLMNLRTPPKLEFIGPLLKREKQLKHGKRFLVSGILEKEIRPILGASAVYGSDTTDLRPYYQDSEMVICHGGHTTIMESLAYGKPVVCVVDKSYSERRNNAMMLERIGVGVHLDKDLLDARSLDASIRFARTLDHERLALYKETADKMDPIAILEKIFSRLR